jgi:hypothetical protein
LIPVILNASRQVLRQRFEHEAAALSDATPRWKHLAREQRDFRQARAFYVESLRLRQDANDTNALLASLEDFAELAAAEQQWARMTRLLGAARALREAAGKPLLPGNRAHSETSLRDARSALAKEAFAAAWAEGRAMSLEQAIAAALELPDIR